MASRLDALPTFITKNNHSCGLNNWGSALKSVVTIRPPCFPKSSDSICSADFALKQKGGAKRSIPLCFFNLIPWPEIMSRLGSKSPCGTCSVKITYLYLVNFSTMDWTSALDKCCSTCRSSAQSAWGRESFAISKQWKDKWSAWNNFLLRSIKSSKMSMAV